MPAGSTLIQEDPVVARPRSDSYTSTAKWFHWGMAAIWIASWCVGILATHWRDEFNADHGLTILHKAMASTLLFLIVLRVAWRLVHPAPDLPGSMSPLMQRVPWSGMSCSTRWR